MSNRKATLPITSLLAALADGTSLRQACADLGVVYRTFHRHCASDPSLLARVNEARLKGSEATFPHGTRTGSNRGCRCESCRFANAEGAASYRTVATGAPCPYCGRIAGSRGGRRYAHHSEPGIVCPGSERSSGCVRAESRQAS